MKVTVKPGFKMNVLRNQLRLLNAFKHSRFVEVEEEVAAFLVSQNFLEYVDDDVQRDAMVPMVKTVRPLRVMPVKECTDERPIDPRLLALQEERSVSDLMQEADKRKVK